jgi:hypothetical protein
MASENLGSVVLDVVENNRRMVQAMLGAYRTGGTKLIGQSLSGRFGGRGARAAQFLSRGIDKTSTAIETAVSGGNCQVSNAVARINAWAGQIDNRYASRYLQLLGTLSLPGARVARALSGQLASGADRLYGAGAPIASKPARRSIKRRRATRKA